MQKFELVINKNFVTFENLENLPRIGVKNVTIDSLNIVDSHKTSFLQKLTNPMQRLLGYSSSDEPQTPANTVEFKSLMIIINHFKDSIESLKITETKMKNVEVVREMMKNLTNLKHFEVSDLNFVMQIVCTPLNLPNLQSISMRKERIYNQSVEELFKLFHNSQQVDKVVLDIPEWSWHGFNHELFNELLKSFPKLNHLVMLGTGSASYFDQNSFPYKVEKLEAYLIGFNWNETTPRLYFLKSQIGSLKELKLHKLPYDYDGGEVLKFIIEEMKLDKFYYGDKLMISNGKKRDDVEEIWFNEVTVTAGMEMLRQFPCKFFYIFNFNKFLMLFFCRHKKTKILALCNWHLFRSNCFNTCSFSKYFCKN